MHVYSQPHIFKALLLCVELNIQLSFDVYEV